MQANFAREAEMGSGTYGVVFSARSPSGRRSAIKYNLKSRPWDFVGCLRELNINHQLSHHPHIIPLKRIAHGEPFHRATELKKREGIVRDEIHFIFPLAEGNLAAFLQRRTDITMPELHRYMAQLLLAVEYVHAMGFIHRDIKSENVLVMREEGKYVMKLGDFGLSKPFNRYQPQTPGVMTCFYRAPEVVLGAEDYDQRADLWPLGCVFYEMVAGRALINVSKDDDLQVLRQMSTVLPYHVSSELLSQMDRSGISRSVKWRGFQGTCEDFLCLNPGGGMIFDGCGGMPLFWDFLLSLLCFDPRQRASASEAIEHGWMKPHLPYCRQVRSQHRPRERQYPPYCVSQDEMRGWMTVMVMEVWHSRRRHGWYQDQILFHSLAVMDRAIVHGLEMADLDPSAPYNGGVQTSAERGRERVTRRKVELIYLTCLYMAVKYYTTLQVATSFANVAGRNYGDSSSLKLVRKYEKWIMSDVICYDYYHPTPYDLLCRLESPAEEEIYSLLFFMTVGHHDGKTAEQALQFWQQHRSYYAKVALEYQRNMQNDR